jgi:hypothetical protein
MKKFLLIGTFISVFASSQQSDLLKIRTYRMSYLDEKIRETSGLNLFDGKLYTFNDSGNTPELFQIDKASGKIISTWIVNAENKDWEALTNDGKNFYIGDFGNNSGTRKDLGIYKVSFENNELKNEQITLIQFEYPEQTDFIPGYLKTNFDAEAMIWLNGKIHLFTKEWDAKSTSHYIIDPEISEKQKAQKTESYKTGFVVTDASYDNGKLYLVGYTRKTEVFLDIFSETEPGIFFKEAPKRYYLGSALSIGQIEGIAVDENGLYISGEKFHSPLGSAKQALYFIPKEKLKD